MKKEKGFTLIELIAVLVIMAILALIVTPLVMSIIRKARVSADKRSIDAYGRSIELAIAGYLLDNGTFPTSMEQLTIEYSGDEVVCSTTQLNSDSSVYLAGCTVGGRSVDNYTYGHDLTPPTTTYEAYSVGDEVTYNNVAYRVIKDSNTSESTVTLLKAEPLTVAEVNQYGVGHLNRYTYDTQETAFDSSGYGGVAYYTSEECGFPYGPYGGQVNSGCITDYAQSEVKYVVDAWKADKAPLSTEARLITFEELTIDLGCTTSSCSNTPYSSWIHSSNYDYWTGSQYNDSTYMIWRVASGFGEYTVDTACGVVRPVIVLPKSAL